MFRREGIPMPTSQFPVRAANGDAFARSDFGWEEHRTIGEFDGAQKYGRLLRPGERAGDRIYQEKLREDRIRDAGFQVVRWTWDDLEQPPGWWWGRCSRAFDRGGRSIVMAAASGGASVRHVKPAYWRRHLHIRGATWTTSAERDRMGPTRAQSSGLDRPPTAAKAASGGTSGMPAPGSGVA